MQLVFYRGAVVVPSLPSSTASLFLLLFNLPLLISINGRKRDSQILGQEPNPDSFPYVD